jgi:hypothetical protein
MKWSGISTSLHADPISICRISGGSVLPVVVQRRFVSELFSAAFFACGFATGGSFSTALMRLAFFFPTCGLPFFAAAMRAVLFAGTIDPTPVSNNDGKSGSNITS